jgi:hypothetical protein
MGEVGDPGLGHDLCHLHFRGRGFFPSLAFARRPSPRTRTPQAPPCAPTGPTPWSCTGNDDIIVIGGFLGVMRFVTFILLASTFSKQGEPTTQFGLALPPLRIQFKLKNTSHFRMFVLI